MTLNFSREKLLIILGGAISIIIGVSLTNGSKQMGQEAPMIGSFFFIGGWIVVMYGMGFSLWAVLGGLMVIGAVIIKEAENVPAFFKFLVPVLFISGWVSVAYAAAGGTLDSLTLESPKVWLSGLAALGVFVSMFVLLPYERKHKVTDGVGMALFTSSWVLLAAAVAFNENEQYYPIEGLY